jgi:hypothetical protein
MSDEKAKFHETQIAADGRRYPTDQIDRINEQIAKGEEPEAVEFEEGVHQEGSGTVADGKQGDELSTDHAVPGEPVTRDLEGREKDEKEPRRAARR